MNESIVTEKKILGWGKYEFTVLWWFFLIWGLVFLDRLVMPYTAPVVMADLQITEVQYGLINTFTTGCYAIAAIFLTGVLEATGKRKKWLIILCLGAGVFACLGAITQDVWQLLITRAMVGLCEGPIAPLIFAILVRESSNARLAVNVGIVNMGVSVIAVSIGPILVTQIATATNWRYSFLVAGVISIIASVFLLKFIKEKPFIPEDRKESMLATFKKLLKYRNVVLSFFIGILTMMYYWTLMLYATRFFVEVAGNELVGAGFIVSIMGASGIAMNIIVPKVSDLLGRRPAIVMWYLVAAVLPFVMYGAQKSMAAVIMYAILGYVAGSIFPLFQAVIPGETLPNYMLGTASGLIVGLSEILGGSAWPAAAGFVARSYGIPTVILFAGFAAIIAAALSMFLKETRGKKDEVQDVRL
ncbi:MAG: MFS transporter [Clostridiales bacterium]|nr:MFS transporter [Clostridiales bacterium]